jgi:hypothetical protein
MPIEYLRPGWVGISKQWLRRHDLKIQAALAVLGKRRTMEVEDAA